MLVCCANSIVAGGFLCRNYSGLLVLVSGVTARMPYAMAVAKILIMHYGIEELDFVALGQDSLALINCLCQ
jgi:hypothetical protein